jgi:hypothetical protein
MAWALSDTSEQPPAVPDVFLALSTERKSAGYRRSNTEKRVDQRICRQPRAKCRRRGIAKAYDET